MAVGDPTRSTSAAFVFVARGPRGRRVTGTIKAVSRRAAWVSLVRRGLDPIEVSRRHSLWDRMNSPKVTRTDLLHLTRQIAAFSRAGVPIIEAVDGMAEGHENRTLGRALEEISSALREGESLSVALSAHEKIFPVFYRAAVRAAEQTGYLDVTLDRLADYLERDLDNRRKVRSAFAYPSVILFVAIGVVILLATVVMPRFEQLFVSIGGELPLATRILIVGTNFIGTWWPVLIALLIGSVLGIQAFAQTPKGQLFRDRLILATPGIGALFHTSLVERFLRSMGSMLAGGVPMLDALRIATEGTNNAVFRSKVASVRQRVLEGEGIAQPLADTGLFPLPAIRMIRVGERTATLDTQLVVTADFYDKELDYRLKRFTSMIEPGVMILAGLLVGFIAIALVSAMYSTVGAGGIA